MEQSDIPEKKPKRKGLYNLLIIVVGLVVFLFLQEKKIKKQQAIKMQFIEEKNTVCNYSFFPGSQNLPP